MLEIGCCSAVRIVSFSAVLILAASSNRSTFENDAHDPEEIKKFVESVDETKRVLYQQMVEALWNYKTNMTDQALRLSTSASARYHTFSKQAAANASWFDVRLLANNSKILMRRFAKIKNIGFKLDKNDTEKLHRLISDMGRIYSEATICAIRTNFSLPKNPLEDCDTRWSLEPQVYNFMAKNRDFDRLAHVFNAWHRATGDPVELLFRQYITLSNKGARQGGFNDTGELWRSAYEEDDFEKELDDLWHQLLPLYENLHTYARKRLSKYYGGRFNTSALPAHILGDTWAQDWYNIFDLLLPYPNKSTIDVTQEMIRQNYTVNQMFHLADDFFSSLALPRMPADFWQRSIFEKPIDNRSMVCHGSAWDFLNSRYSSPDVRILMCAAVDMNYFIAIHHEIGHLIYALSYINQSTIFREGTNPGFHEAIGDTIGLSVSTPSHLHLIGLLPNFQSDTEQDINYLLKIAIEKVAFLPFAYLVDKWRYGVFNGEFDADSWNSAWWRLRYINQGIVPPLNQNQSGAFDPGSKYHVVANSPFASYFVSFIIQFQFYKSMCVAAGHQGLLHHCDFYNSTAAGELLARMMRLGSSEHWSVAMKLMTGQSKMNASDLLTYFEPLNAWLDEQNQGECFGWGYRWPESIQATLKVPRCDRYVKV